MEGEKKTKYFKNIFIIITVVLILLAIYIICIKNNTEAIEETKNIRTLNISKNIIIGITEFDTLNPITTKSIEVQYLTKLIYKPLIEITKDFNVQESIAKEWSKTGEKEYIIKLGDVKWHNGSEVTARDVEFTINTIKNSDSIYKRNVESIETIEIIDDKTIKFTLSETQDFFEYLLCFPIVKENTYDIANIGTNSYQVEEITEKQIILKNNERKITINIYDTISELYSAFSKEKVDIIITQNNNYQEYIGNIGISYQLITGRNFYYINFNEKLEKNTRYQIKKLINREQIIYELYNNKYIIADFPLEYGSYLNSAIEYKNEKNDVLTTQLTLGITNEEEMYKIAEIIKKQLEEEGIDVDIIYYYNFENAINNSYYDLVLDKETVPITPNLDVYFKGKNLQDIYQIENREILKQKYEELIKQYSQELPFMGLFFNSYIILHNSSVKGDFSGNWYNPFYGVDTYYKVD